VGQKVGVDRLAVIEAATVIADRDGLDATTPSAVATELGIRTPSLYYHVQGADGLRRALALHAAAALTSAFQAVQDEPQGSNVDRLKLFARAYRNFASEHPGLHAALLPAPHPGEDDELAEAMAAPVRIVAAELGGGQDLTEDSVHRIRMLRALLYGFASLESQRGFGLETDIDESFEYAVDLMASSIVRTPTQE